MPSTTRLSTPLLNDAQFASNVKSKSDSGVRPLHTRHNGLYVYGVISFTPTLQRGQHTRQLDEVLRAEMRASGGEDKERIGATNIRPARW